MSNLRVDGHDEIFKNTETGVINNRSSTDRDKYRIAKKQAMLNITSQEEILNLKSEMGEIKQLLQAYFYVGYLSLSDEDIV